MKFSRKLKLLSLILLSLTVIFIYNKTNYNNINYTVLGDGLSLGINNSGNIDYSYSDYVKEYLKDSKRLNKYSKEFTKKDMTIEKLLNTILNTEKMNRNNNNFNIIEIIRDSDFISISIGLNDLLYKLSKEDDLSNDKINTIILEIEESFNNLITEIRKYNSGEIYVIGYYDTNSKDTIFKKSINKLNNIFKNNKNIIYISTSTISKNQTIFRPNSTNYYPNYKGYQLISDKIISKMRKKLEK